MSIKKSKNTGYLSSILALESLSTKRLRIFMAQMQAGRQVGGLEVSFIVYGGWNEE